MFALPDSVSFLWYSVLPWVDAIMSLDVSKAQSKIYLYSWSVVVIYLEFWGGILCSFFNSLFWNYFNLKKASNNVLQWHTITTLTVMSIG